MKILFSMKTNLDWFPFRVDTLNSLGFKTLLRKYGFAGVGKLIILKSIVANAPNCELDLNDEEVIEQLQYEIDFDEIEDLEKFISVLKKTKTITQKKGTHSSFISFDDVTQKLSSVMKHRQRNQSADCAQDKETERKNEKESAKTPVLSADLDREDKIILDNTIQDKTILDKLLIKKIDKKSFDKELKPLIIDCFISEKWIKKTCKRFDFSEEQFQDKFFEFLDFVDEFGVHEKYTEPKNIQIKRHFTNWYHKKTLEETKKQPEETSDWSHLQVLD